MFSATWPNCGVPKMEANRPPKSTPKACIAVLTAVNKKSGAYYAVSCM